MTFAHWAKTNAVALATWLGVVLSVIATGAANVALAGDKQDMLVAKVEEHDESIVRLESDVRSISEQQARLVKVVERTEAILIELDRTTAELKVMVQTIRQ
tara:strand:- start:6895 stop:7197 length:303 start_codon:yes stop_codon:yes gene_type:complete